MKVKAKVTEIHPGFYCVRKATKWVVSSNAPKSIDDLEFIGRDSSGFPIWWEVQPPNTSYCHAHEMLGRAHAFDFLEYLNNPKTEQGPHTLRFIVSGMLKSAQTDWRARSVIDGFFDVIGEYLITGTAAR